MKGEGDGGYDVGIYQRSQGDGIRRESRLKRPVNGAEEEEERKKKNSEIKGCKESKECGRL